VIFPKTPIIIAKNLNTTDEIRIAFGIVEKCDELFAMVVVKVHKMSSRF
jgi:hypothetical protein